MKKEGKLSDESVMKEEQDELMKIRAELGRAYRHRYQNVEDCNKHYDDALRVCSEALKKLAKFKKSVLKNNKDKQLYKKVSESGKISDPKISIVQVLGLLKYFITSIDTEYEGKSKKCE